MNRSAEELNLSILEQLLGKGYTHFLAEPAREVGELSVINLELVGYEPDQDNLPAGFTSWFEMIDQGYEMARGVYMIIFKVYVPEYAI